jgi:anti-sigma factor RsiW
MKRNDEALFLTAAVDGELDIRRSIELQWRLAEDQALKAAWDAQMALRSGIRKAAPYHVAPAALRLQLQRSCSLAHDATRVVPKAKPIVIDDGRRRWALAAGLAGLASALSAGLTMLAVRSQERALAGAARLADAVVASHVRTQLLGQQIEVASSDQHTVRPWLSARMTYSPPVPDLASHGFELVGARRDVIDAQAMAVLVYHRKQHVISVFVSPDAAQLKTQSVEHRGFHVLGTTHQGMAYVLVSDMRFEDLELMAALITRNEVHRSEP